MNALVTARKEFSEGKIRELEDTLRSRLASASAGEYTVFAAGSYGRLEAGRFSDLDLFFVHSDEADPTEISQIIDQSTVVVKDLGYPPLTERFLKPYNSTDATAKLGSPEDDFHNHFTCRLLLLLESRCVYNKEFYSRHLQAVIDAYFRDYHSHSDGFRPIFLVNDIVRYWKTICLNYENRRNEEEHDPIEAKVKNFKLKFSRLATCYATIAALACIDSPPPKQVLDLVLKTPISRLLEVQKMFPSFSTQIALLIELYAWFLKMTELSTAELQNEFRDREMRRNHFQRAEDFGDAFYQLLKEIDSERRNKLMRFIAI